MESGEVIDQGFLSRLPLPLAQLYRRAHTTKTSLDGYLTAFYLWEAGMKLLSATAIAEYVAQGAFEPEIDERLRYLARPTLGHWWQCGTRIVPMLARHDAEFQTLRDVLFGRPRDDLPAASYLNELLGEVEQGRRSRRSSVHLGQLFERLMDYRNREIAQRPDEQRTGVYHDRMAPALLNAFTEVFSLFDPLANRQLFYIDRVYDHEHECVVEGYRLIGETHETKIAPISPSTLRDRPTANLMYLFSEQTSSLVLMAPLLRYDSEGGEAFFLDGARSNTRLNYLCYTSGNVRQHAPLEVEQLFVNRVLKVPEQESDPGTLSADDVPAMESEVPAHSGESIPRRIGEYEIQEIQARGGFGAVYRAWQSSLGRLVALKTHRRGSSQETESRFHREIQALARVDHPNLVKVYDSGMEADMLYYAMEYIPGGTFLDYVQQLRGDGSQVRMDRNQISLIVTLIRQVVEALSALHHSGIIHGDPKPSNILVTPDGLRAVLIDPLIPASEAPDAIFGTPKYMSPERVRGEGRGDHRSDLYAIGVILWESLTGRPRFQADSIEEIFGQIAASVPEPIRPLNPAVSPDLEAIVLKCLEPELDRRYSTAEELANDLRRWLAGQAVLARPHSGFRRIRHFLFRHPWQVGMASLLFLTTAALGWAIASLRSLKQEVQEYKNQLAAAGHSEPPPESPVSHPTSGEVGWIVAAALSVLVAVQWVTMFRRRKLERGTVIDTEAEPLKEPHPPKADEAIAAPPHPVARARPRTPADDAFSSQAVVLRYPAPIAIAYRRFCGRGEPRDRLAQLFDTFEITLKYLVYLGLSDLCACRLASEPPIVPLSKHQGFDLVRQPTRMTLGRWVRSLLDVADALAKEPNRFVHEFPQVCGTKGFLNREIFGWIKDNRDAATHRKGGISLHSEKCVPLIRQARPRLERLLQEIVFLRRYPLGFVTAGYPGAGARSRYRVHSCMGARIAFGEEVYPMETDVQLPLGVPFVVAPDESQILCLWPFLLQRESDATQRPSIYVFEEIDADRRYMSCIHASAIDHEDSWVNELHPTDADDHNWLWDALRGLPQQVAITPTLRLAEGLAESVVGRLTDERLGDQDQYLLVGPIARGGFGTVYDALDVRTNTRVAVKVLEDHEGLEAKDDLAQLRRFQQEYEKLRSAGQEFSGIIRCFEWGIDILGRREYPWFSMEFAAGGDLNERLIERRATLHGDLVWNRSELRTVAIEEFRAIVEAVAHLHDLNIIHRDIKPANVLILDEGKLRLSDFGLIKEVDRQRTGVSVGPGSSRGTVVGTRDYMAPEQERGDQVTKAADVYSLGIVLAELATGYRPVSVQGTAAGSPIERDEFVDRLPEPLRRLILHWTDVDPTQRPDDARYAYHQYQQALKKTTS